MRPFASARGHVVGRHSKNASHFAFLLPTPLDPLNAAFVALHLHLLILYRCPSERTGAPRRVAARQRILIFSCHRPPFEVYPTPPDREAVYIYLNLHFLLTYNIRINTMKKRGFTFKIFQKPLQHLILNSPTYLVTTLGHSPDKAYHFKVL